MSTINIEQTNLIDPDLHTRMNHITITDTATDTLQLITGPEHDHITVNQITGNVFIDTGPGNDQIHIQNITGNLEVFAGSGNDSVFIYTAIGGHSVVYGENGDDMLLGGPGDDNLYGGHGDDVLIGRGGSDVLEGGNNTGHYKHNAQGELRIISGDHLWGGYNDPASYDGAANIFVFRNGDGVQTIHDYQIGLDTIEIHGYSKYNAHLVSNGENTFIKLSDTAGILVLNAQLQAADIDWVVPTFHACTLSPDPIVELEDASHQSIHLVGKFSAYERDSGDPCVDNDLKIARIGVPIVRLDGQPFLSEEIVSLLTDPNALLFTELTSYAKRMKVSYEYNVNDIDLDFLAEGQELTVSYRLVVENHMAHSPIQELTITIIGTNDIPIITGTDIGTVKEDNEPNAITQVSGALMITDLDAGENSFQLPIMSFDSQNEWTYTLRTVTPFDTEQMIFDNNTNMFKENMMPNMISRADLVEAVDVVGSYGTFNFSTNGEWVYTLDNSVGSATDQLREGEVVHDLLVVTSFDGSVFKTIDITVIGTNDLPVIGGDQTGNIIEGDGVTVNSISGTLTIADPDAGENSFVTLGNLVANYGVFTFDNATGEWTYTVNDSAGSAVDRLREGEVIFDQLVVGSFDGSTPISIEVSITGTNDLPVIGGVSTGDVKEDNAPDAVTVTSGALTIADIDNGESLFLVPENLEGVYGTFTFDESGSWTYTLNNAVGSATDQLGEGVVVHDTLTVTSFDGSTPTVIDITVTGTNDEPVIFGVDSAEVKEDNADGAITTAFGSLFIVDPDAGESSFQLPTPPEVLMLSEVFADQGTFAPAQFDHFSHASNLSSVCCFDVAPNQTDIVL